MNKTMFSIPNMTGRIFVCLTNNPEYTDEHNDNFTIGLNYREAIMSIDGDRMQDIDENSIILLDNNSVPIIVDTKDFILIDEKINQLALLPFALN